MRRNKPQWTQKEAHYIARLQKVLGDLPDTLRLYAIDSGLHICKVGVPEGDLAEWVGNITDAGAVLSDLHDAHFGDLP